MEAPCNGPRTQSLKGIATERADAPAAASAAPAHPRAPYVPPEFERLGAWSALTLQQSININP